MNEVITINGNYDDMAKAMGIAEPVGTEVQKKSASSLARLKLSYIIEHLWCQAN